jgi:hypothetical protein
MEKQRYMWKRSVLMGLVGFWIAGCAVFAQGESERDLKVIPTSRPTANAERGGGLLTLPFFDDFSTPSTADAPAWVPSELIRWEAGSASITNTYSIKAPTIGAATFNGCDRTGYPYNWSESAVGWADTLTSLPINLNGYSTTAGVHLVFSIQRGGRGNAADVEEDSLAVEFKITDGSGEPVWIPVWSTDSCGTTDFTRFFIPVDEQAYLQAGFQFRFRNYGALAGNVDLWHLDYVLLDDGIDPFTYSVVSEVAFIEPVNTLLRDFTRMPWTHYVQNPSLFMRDSILSFHRNYSATQADNVASGFTVNHDGNAVTFINPPNTFVAPSSEFSTLYQVGLPPASFSFDPTVSDTAASFEVTLFESSIGIQHEQKLGVLDNDSIGFLQVFANDYAYDDGSAERAYALTAGAAKLAMRFPLAQPDTLLGLAIHFTPYYNDASQETFLLRVWDDAAGTPGAELGTNYQFHSPSYYVQGPDVFGYFPLDEPLAVEGVIHVGVLQSTDAMLNYGLDKNTNANVGNVHYTLGVGAPWIQSEIEGTVMIRPVFRAGMEQEWVGVMAAESHTLGSVSVIPNPAQDVVRIAGPSLTGWVVMDLTGRMVAQGVSGGEGGVVLDASFWDNGLYVIRFATGEFGKWIIRH